MLSKLEIMLITTTAKAVPMKISMGIIGIILVLLVQAIFFRD